jgi:hypothetical protein
MSIKTFLRNYLIEQDENLVIVTPEQYIETLENVGGIADRITKLKPYRGKGIVINGDLNLRKFPTIGPLTGVVRVQGRLDISNTNVPNLNGIKIDGYVSDHGSTMYTNKLKQKRNYKLSQLSQYRENDEWNVDNKEDESERTEALYDYLIEEGIPDRIEYEDGREDEEDKYFIYPNGRGNYGIGKQYEWIGGEYLEPTTYDVYTQDELDVAAKRQVELSVDDMGYDAFTSWVWKQAIDRDEWERWLTDFYGDIIRDDPENYDIPLELSVRQIWEKNRLQLVIDDLNEKLERNKIERKPQEENEQIESKIESLEETIQEIIDDPQGGYDENAIEQEIDDRVSEYVDDLDDFVKHFGYDSDFIMDFIDLDELTKIIVDSDGYGSLLNSYDGEMFETRINGDWYFVMRVD